MGTIRFALMAGGAVIFASPFSQAQEGGVSSDMPAVSIGEIIVTARRDAERLQDVPASISVLTADTLERAAVTDMASIANFTPGVTIVTGAAEVGDTQVNIRGMNGARDAESNVALVVDGILKTNTAQLNQVQGKLSQVEVLKGPQGAFYGRNAASGAIVMTTAKPGDSYAVQVTGGVAENSTTTGQFIASGPLTDKTGFVLFADWRKTDGSWRNTGPAAGSRGATVDRYRGITVGGRVIAAASDLLELDFKARYGNVDASALSYDVTFNLPTFALGNPDFNENVNDMTFDFLGNVKPDNDQRTFETSLKATYDLTWATATGWVLYSDVYQEFVADSTSASLGRFWGRPSCRSSVAQLFGQGYTLPSPQFLASTPEASVLGAFGPTTCDGIQFQIRDQKDISTEIRLASAEGEPLRWSAGAYYLHIDRRTGLSISEDQGQGAIRQLYNDPNTTNPTSLLFDDKFKTNVYAAFGSLEYKLDTLTLSGALRYDREERKVDNQVPRVRDPITGGWINPGFNSVSGDIPSKSRTYQEVQPKISLSWVPTPTFTTFANWGIGFKAGGFNQQGSKAIIDDNFNGPLGSNIKIEDDYRKETSSAFEVGFKSSLLNGRLSLDGAAYYTKVTDMQFFEFFTGTFGLLRVVSNIDDVRVKGVELSSSLQLIEGWNVFASGNVTDSEIKKNESRTDTVGNKSPYTADYTLNLGSQIVAPLLEDADIVLRVDWRLTGPTWFHTVQDQSRRTVFDLFFPGAGTANYTKTQRDAFSVLNLRGGLDFGSVTVMAYANNLLDKQIIAEVIPAPEFGGAFVAPGARRVIGVEASLKF